MPRFAEVDADGSALILGLAPADRGRSPARRRRASRPVRPRQPDRLVHRPVRLEAPGARGAGGDAGAAGLPPLRLRLAGRARPDLRRRGRGPEAARRRAGRLLARARGAERRRRGRSSDVLKRHGVKARALGPPRRRRGPGRRAPSSGGGSRRRRRSSGRWPRRPRRSAARWPSTTTAAGSASRRTRSPSSRPSRSRGSTTSGSSTTCTTATTHLDRLPALLALMMPYLKAVNLNGMDPGADPGPRKILPLGPGLARPGPAPDDPRLRLPGADRHPRPHPGRRRGAAPGQPRRPRLAGPAARRQARRPPAEAPDARRPRRPPPRADAAPGRPVDRRRPPGRRPGPGRPPARGRGLRLGPKFGCLTCHKVAGKGGEVGPDLSAAGLCIKPEEVVESVLWPRLKVKEGYDAVAVATRRRPGPPGLQAGRDRARSWSSATPPRARSARIPRDQVEAVQRRRDPDARGAGRRHDPGRAPGPGPVPDRPGQARLDRPRRPPPPRPTPRPRSPTTATRSTPPGSPAGSSRSTASGSTTSTPRRPSTSRKRPEVPPLLPPFPGPRRRGQGPLGEPERGRLGRRPVERGPTSGRCSRASSGGPA